MENKLSFSKLDKKGKTFFSTPTDSCLVLTDGPGAGKTTALFRNVHLSKNPIFLYETHNAREDKEREMNSNLIDSDFVLRSNMSFEDFRCFVKNVSGISEDDRNKYLDIIAKEASVPLANRTEIYNKILKMMYKAYPEVQHLKKVQQLDEQPDTERPLNYVRDFVLDNKTKFEKVMYKDSNHLYVSMTYDKIISNSTLDLDKVHNKTFIIDENITEKLIEVTESKELLYISMFDDEYFINHIPKNLRIKIRNIAKIIRENELKSIEKHKLTDEEFNDFISYVYKYAKENYTLDELREEFAYLQSEIIFSDDKKIHGIKIKKLPSVKNGNRYIVSSADIGVLECKILAYSIDLEYKLLKEYSASRKQREFKPTVYQIPENSTRSNLVNEVYDKTVEKIKKHRKKGDTIIGYNNFDVDIDIFNSKGTNKYAGKDASIIATPTKSKIYYLTMYALSLLVTDVYTSDKVCTITNIDQIREQVTVKDKDSNERKIEYRHYVYTNEGMERLKVLDQLKTLKQAFGRVRQNLHDNSIIVFVGQCDISKIAKPILINSLEDIFA